MGDVLGRRIAAAIIDAFIIAVLLVIVAKTLGDEGATKRSVWAETEGSPRAVFLLLTFAYFFATELVWGQTIGKRVMKLRVVGLDGSKLGAGPAALRNLVRFIDAFPALYIVGAITILVMLLLYRPATTWPGFLIVLIGVPIFMAFRRGHR